MATSGGHHPDPGWPGGSRVLLGMVPFAGPLLFRRAFDPSSAPPITMLRGILLTVVSALPLLLAVLVFALPAELGGTEDPAVWVLLGAGTAAAIGGGLFARRRVPTCGGPTEMAGEFRATFFVGVAMAESAALLGFVASFLVSAIWPFVVGLVPSAIGFTLFAPTRARIAANEQQLRAAGCPHSLADALYQPPGDGDGRAAGR
jgi:F0F1-type ATP synthase membrane subunit c/vacuolar-type H+-ATPase subunit K